MGLGVDGWTKDTRTILSTVQQLKRLGVRAEPKWLKIMRKYPPLNMSPLYEKPEHSYVVFFPTPPIPQSLIPLFFFLFLPLGLKKQAQEGARV